MRTDVEPVNLVAARTVGSSSIDEADAAHRYEDRYHTAARRIRPALLAVDELFGVGLGERLRRLFEDLDENAGEALDHAFHAIGKQRAEHQTEKYEATVEMSRLRVEAAGLRMAGRVLFLELERRALRTGTTRGEVWTMLQSWEKVDPR